jgi:hypothetical protein
VIVPGLPVGHGWDTKAPTKVTMTTPPFFSSRVRIESGTFRTCSVSARAELWEKMTGASVTSRASLMVPGETWDRSTSIPSRFISRTTSRPNSVRPPWRAESAAASAQSRVTLWVRVR